MSEQPCVGIDLGTTYSAIATFGDTGVHVIPNGQRELLTPSVVEVKVDGERIVGTAAQRGAILDPDRVFTLFKRQMGTDAAYLLDGERITPVDLSATVLAQLRSDAQDATGTAIEEATVTVPAYFEDDARIATRNAAEAAGLLVRDLVHEPTAAAVAFGFGGQGESSTVLVYDLGGGTFDVTIVRWTDTKMTVLSTCGDHHLGGANWDAEIAAIVAEEFEARHGVDPRDDMQAGVDLLERAESAKRALSRLERTAVAVVCEEARDRVEITRQAFEERTRPLLARTEWLVKHALDDAHLLPNQLDAVLLVGGSTRMPMCAEALRRASGHAPAQGVDPDQAVVRGAAILAAVRRSARGSHISRHGGTAIARLPEVQDVTPHALGFVVISADGSRYLNEVMIQRNTPIPAERSKTRRLDTPRGGRGELRVYLLQGDAERPSETAPLGSWTFDEVPGGRNGHTDVEIAFRYDRDGVVEIAAHAEGKDLVPTIDRDDRDISWTDGDPRDQAQMEPLSVVLAIDCSTSMEGKAIKEARRACLEFAQELAQHPNCTIELVSFAGGARVLTSPQQGAKAIKQAVARLSASGSTNMTAGIETAFTMLTGHTGRRAVVLLTDGRPDDSRSAEAAARSLALAEIELYPRGVEGADEAFLRRLADGDKDLMTDLEGLAGTFRGIARQLASANALRRV